MHKINRAFAVSASSLFVLLTGVIPAPAQTFKQLVLFNGTDGSNSAYGYAGLVQGTDGYLYGTTPEGGANYACSAAGCGTVFRISPKGVLTTLYSFCSQSGCPDGATPFGGLVEGVDGDFYGTTAGGGSGCLQGGCGTVFKITRNGELTTLHSFDGTDGEEPWGSLVLGGDGSFYGVTAVGTIGFGTVFKVTPSGTLTSLYTFCVQSNCTDGAIPEAGLVAGTDGYLYGTTAQGGIMSCLHAQGELGCGTVFKITPSGTLTTLHRFGLTDGAAPFGALVQGLDGNYYGTTYLGGNKGCDYGSNTCGTVFRMTPGGALTTLL
jgi:uncharacterized repeat protein (TIGR03803 family)